MTNKIHYALDKKNIKKCVDDLRKFNGLPPYNNGSNSCLNDAYFANSISQTHSKFVLKEAEKLINEEHKIRTTFQKHADTLVKKLI